MRKLQLTIISRLQRNTPDMHGIYALSANLASKINVNVVLKIKKLFTFLSNKENNTLTTY